MPNSNTDRPSLDPQVLRRIEMERATRMRRLVREMSRRKLPMPRRYDFGSGRGVSPRPTVERFSNAGDRFDPELGS